MPIDIQFSIITPVYNSEKFLEQCICSILKQSYGNFELILINDGSTDGSRQICEHYAEQDSRIKVLSQENLGQTVARQTAAKIAKGRYIVCIDSDDWVDRDYLLHFKQILDDYSADIVCGGMIRASKVDVAHPIRQRCGYFTKKEIKDEIFPVLIQPAIGESFSVCLCGKIIRTGLFCKYQDRVNPSLQMAEDLSCFLPCMYHADGLYILKECLYYYRDNSDSITKKKNAYDWNGPAYIRDALEEGIDIDEIDFREQLNRRILRELFLVAVSQFHREEKYDVLRRDIILHISEDRYRQVIDDCRFAFAVNKANLRYIFYKVCLKYKYIFLMKIYSKYLSRN